MTIIRILSFAMFTFLAACSSSNGVCADDDCSCSTGTCDFECPQGGCEQSCNGQAECTATCSGGNCSQSCTGSADCTFACSGGDCQQSCLTSSGPCTADCAPGNCISDT